jgi:tetratricopeptide (TPR) repeat protein
MAKRFMKYNPSFLSEEDLVGNFAVRHADLGLIIRVIRENVTDSNQHVLIIGPRGSGKTTLVLRAAAEIQRTRELSERWYPLIFSEESYEVVSAGEFWLEALFHLSEQTGDEKWRRTYVELKDETDHQRLGDRALAQLLDFADSQGKRILLIVENLNMLFGDLTSDEEAWKIRHTLMNEPRLMLLATATRRFETIENSSQAMFEMFKMQDLKPLDDDECNRIWELITGQKLIGERIRPIRILTGGNPRLLTIIAIFSAHRSFKQLLDYLIDLIDDHTEYFKSQLDNLPVIERKVYLALAELWNASTARDVARAARLDVNKTSSLLGRLVGRGAVIVEAQDKKTKWYMVAERMYNIYYLMRRRGKPADRVKAAVKFMVSMYDPESAVKLITEEACGLSPEHCQDHYLAFLETINEIPDGKLREKIIVSAPKIFLESPYLAKALQNIKMQGEKTETTVNLKSKEPSEAEEKIAAYDDIIERFGDDNDLDIRRKVAMAMFNKGATLSQLNRSEDEIAVCDDMIKRFGDDNDPEIREKVTMAMVNKGATLGKLNRSEEALAVYDDMINRFGDDNDLDIREKVARAMFNKGASLGKLNRSEEALAAYDDMINRFGDDKEKTTHKLVEGVMKDKLKVLLTIPERLKDVLQTAEEMIEKNPENANFLNSISWLFYQNRDLLSLAEAEKWARMAVSLSSDNANIHHTLACILSVLGKGNEALTYAAKYIQDTACVEKTIEYAIELFVSLAASGQAKEALDLLLNSEAQKHLEPLVVGLKLYVGEEVKTAIEIREVAMDVVKRIEERSKK